jgi:putative thioredoxin
MISDAPASDPHAVTDFETDVLAASHQQPVLVDFWAPWCGPCRVLGPVLDRLASEAGGRWQLAKVNTDEYPSLMSTYGIRGIPAVKLFSGGAVVAEFTGALPEHQVRAWLDEHLPTEAGRHYQAAVTAWDAGDRETAQALLKAALNGDASGAWVADARLRLARLTVLSDPDAATALLDGMHFPPEVESVRHVATLLGLDPAALPEAPVRARYAEALDALRTGDADAALSAFIEVVQQNRAYDDDGARRAVVALFQTLGEDHPVVKTHRPVFNRSLY